jgi:Ca2+-binding EF-hand superfamily protein
VQAVRLSTEEAISNKRNSEDEILRAFQALDVDKKGYLEAHELQNLMTSYGEKFSSEEVPYHHGLMN